MFTDQIMTVARELGIESKIRVVKDEQLNPLVTVTEGTRAVQSRIQISWLLDRSLTHVKTILSDMHRMANNN
jgi:hypothetical protein